MSPPPVDLLLLGVALAGAGAAGYRFAYEIAWLGALIDAFDFVTPASAVRPAGRNVRTTRAVSAAAVVAGAALVIVFLRALVA